MNAPSIYVSDTSKGTITKFHEDGCSTVVTTGLNGPSGIILDGLGNLLYVANSGGGTIEKFDLSGNRSTFASSLNKPMGLALDRSGNLYAASGGGGTIEKFDSSGHKSTFASGLGITNPYLAFDGGGNLYASNTHTVEKIAPNGTRTTFLNFFGDSVYGLAFDCCGRLYVGLQNAGAIYGLPRNGLFASDNASTFTPAGLAFDRSNGHLYAAFGQSVRKYHLDGCGTVFASGFTSAQYIAAFP